MENFEQPWFKNIWHPLSKHQFCVITNKLLHWIGCDKHAFKKHLDKYNFKYEEIKHLTPEIEKMIIDEYGPQKSEKRCIFMKTTTFKKAMLSLNTETGQIIREYYFGLDKYFWTIIAPKTS